MLRAEEQLGSQAYSTDVVFTDLSRYIFGNYSDTIFTGEACRTSCEHLVQDVKTR